MLKQKGYVGLEDKIAYLSGTFGENGNTTFLEINKVGEIFEDKYKFHVPNGN
jgi:pyruvate kinase